MPSAPRLFSSHRDWRALQVGEETERGQSSARGRIFDAHYVKGDRKSTVSTRCMGASDCNLGFSGFSGVTSVLNI